MDKNNLPTKISIDPTSLVGLKAELLKKQEEFRIKKLGKTSQSVSEFNEYQTAKTETTWGKKKKFESSNNQEIDKSPKNDNNQEIETEQVLLERSRKILESKAKYYDEVLSGAKMTEEGDDEIFLVDFDKKVDQEQIKSRREGLKLKTEINEEEYNEMMRSKWQREVNENLDKLEVHYQDIKYNEIRNMGVGSFQFSRDESERQQQMDFFKNIEKEIKANRITNEIYKLKREKNLLDRLNKLKQRRLRKLGYNQDEIKAMCDFGKDIDEIDSEIKDLEVKRQNPDFYSANYQGEEENEAAKKPVKKVILDREWDKPKLKEKRWEKHIEKLRNERNKLYAPPKFYESQKKKNKLAKYKSVPPPTL